MFCGLRPQVDHYRGSRQGLGVDGADRSLAHARPFARASAGLA